MTASKHGAPGRGKGSMGRTSLEGSKRSFCEFFLEPHANLRIASELYSASFCLLLRGVVLTVTLYRQYVLQVVHLLVCNHCYYIRRQYTKDSMKMVCCCQLSCHFILSYFICM